MRIRALLLFVAIQVISFAAWSYAQPIPQASGYTHAAAKAPFDHVHFASLNASPRTAALDQQRLQNQITEVFKKLPKAHVEAVKNVLLDYDPKAHRGLGGKQMIIVRATMKTEELTSVLIHEIGHNVDLIALKAAKDNQLSAFRDGETPIYMGDPSLDFYRISWENEEELKRTAGNLDFVSGYAMTDPFEDFAETYIYYVLHNQEFKAKVSSSAALYAKYRFIKYRVFAGQEFNTGNALAADPLVRPWDVTVVPYEMEQFLN